MDRYGKGIWHRLGHADPLLHKTNLLFLVFLIFHGIVLFSFRVYFQRQNRLYSFFMQEDQRAVGSLLFHRCGYHSVQWLVCFDVRQGIPSSHDHRQILIADPIHAVMVYSCIIYSRANIIFFLHGLIKRKNSDYSWLLSAISLMLFFAGYRYFIGVDLPWNVDLALLGASFMCLGKWFSTTSFFDYTGKLQMTVQMMPALSISIICPGVNLYFFCLVDRYNNQFGNPLLFILSAITGIVFVIRLSELFPVKFISWLGANTLCFYGFHRLVIDYSLGLYNKLGFITQGIAGRIRINPVSGRLVNCPAHSCLYTASKIRSIVSG